MDPLKTTRAAFWRRQAALTAWRHNASRALAEFLPLGLGVSIVFACALLVVRQHGGAGLRWCWFAYGAGLLAAGLVAVWRSRRDFFNLGDALVRLEWHLGLHNRLSAAAAGVGDYPAPQPASDGLRVRWRKIVPPLAGAAVLVGSAAWVPVSTTGAKFLPTAAPPAWTQTAGWIDALRKTESVQEPAVEDLRERLEQLQNQPARDWFSQSSLEAGDNLREQTAQSMESLRRDLQSALDNMEAMQRFTDQTSATEMKATRENLESALKGLEMGNLPLNRELLNQLKQADLSNLKSLTPAQIAELKRRLKEGTKVCQACLHPGEMEGKLAGLMVVKGAAVGQPGRKDERGGGVSSAPLTLNEKPTQLGTTATEAVSNADLEHASPGELLGVGKGDHPVDPAKYTGPVAGGAIASNGEGGEAVWRNDLTPKEREVLKKFFK